MHALGVVADEPVVEPLVVAVVEALLLERVLEVPVGLGQEHEVASASLDGIDQRRPVLPVGTGPRAIAPGALEHVVHHQHRHVAPHAVALVGDGRDGVGGGAPEIGRERVQLDDVRPRREVRVAAVGEHAIPDADEGRGVAREVLVIALHEVLGVRRGPRMVGRDVVRHEVEQQPEAALGHRLARRRETVGTTQVPRDGVGGDAVGGADDIVRRPVRERALEVLVGGRRCAARSRCPPGSAPTRPSARRRRSRAPRSRPTRSAARHRGRRRGPAGGRGRRATPRC